MRGVLLAVGQKKMHKRRNATLANTETFANTKKKRMKDGWLKYEMTLCLRLLLRAATLATVQSAYCHYHLMNRKEGLMHAAANSSA